MLPIIYQPFDITNKLHWRDRGSIIDFIKTIEGKNKIMDFGPGDGWPSLMIAPHVKQIIGVDASPERIRVCNYNAYRLGIKNVQYIQVAAGSPLPFDDNTFDGIVAASSIEQTPDPRATLGEMYRILKPKCCLKFSYESLHRYEGGQERELWAYRIDDLTSRLDLYDRDIVNESAHMYGLIIKTSLSKLFDLLNCSDDLHFDSLTEEKMVKLQPNVREVRFCSLKHPSARTWINWLAGIGFERIYYTPSGADYAEELFATMAGNFRPTSLQELDALLKTKIGNLSHLDASINSDPLITAEK
jgi:ubiquinone/menaquinone biosynthesis C-methylase UbiE